MYKNVGVGGRPPATGCKAGMQLPPLILPVINGRSKGVLCMKLIASATLSVPLLCLSQSESLSQLSDLHNLNLTQ